MLNNTKQPVPLKNILPFENSFSIKNTSSLQTQILSLLQKGNIPLAEIYIRIVLSKKPSDPYALNFLGWISSALNLHEIAIFYFEKALEKDNKWKLPHKNIDKIKKYLKIKNDCNQDKIIKNNKTKNTKYLLIKAWGYGFFSDVSHVLGQLLIAELTERSPIVYWGKNSLFGDGTEVNAFEHYFESFSKLSINEFEKNTFSYWPPKWNNNNLKFKEVNKWHGPYSRIAGQYFLNRPENVVISDFYSGIVDIKPWIPSTNPLFKLSINEIYYYLVNKYLHPKTLIKKRVDSFLQNKLMKSSFIAVHVRGSDKVIEQKNLDSVNKQYEDIINKKILIDPSLKIFLMTDDIRILNRYYVLYGDRVVATKSQRTNGNQGVHYKNFSNSLEIGFEVMTDVYIAAKAEIFIGNGWSNTSQIVRYLKKWSEKDIQFIGPEINLSINTFLHNW
ncbi:O-fucosyltransferase family protein [Candidatus Pelagibacter sp.]|nr:O-fucosyltransferase family protein [Candidatus Pelagibacter sp.]